MTMIKKTRPATWLTGGAVALSATAADAALVKVDIGITESLQNFTTSKDFSSRGLKFGYFVGDVMSFTGGTYFSTSSSTAPTFTSTRGVLYVGAWVFDPTNHNHTRGEKKSGPKGPLSN